MLSVACLGSLWTGRTILPSDLIHKRCEQDHAGRKWRHHGLPPASRTFSASMIGIAIAVTPLQLRRLPFHGHRYRCARASSAAPMRSLLARIQGALTVLTAGLTERSVEAKLLLLAALGGEHVFFLGPPGTAKSLLARRLAEVCGGQYFETALTKFTVPEEIFGPLSIKALENDQLRRRTEGYLPGADVAFLDEVFKANSSILNALLTLLNERAYDNGGDRIAVPLWCAVAASNELPDGDVDALYDRFLLRRVVPAVSDKATFGFLQAALAQSLDEDRYESADGVDQHALDGSFAELLTADDSRRIRLEAAERVAFPQRLLELVAELRIYLREEVEPPVLISDRRLARAISLVRVAAYASGACEVSEPDLFLLQYMFWHDEPQQATAVRNWLVEHCAAHVFRGGSGDILVAGSGKAHMDGVYTRDGKRQGRAVYRQIGGPGVIYWNLFWHLDDGSFPGGAGAPPWYDSTSKAEPSDEPPTGTWTTAYGDADPAPTLERSASDSGNSVIREARMLLAKLRSQVVDPASLAELLQICDAVAELRERRRQTKASLNSWASAPRAFWLEPDDEDAVLNLLVPRATAAADEVDDVHASVTEFIRESSRDMVVT